MSNDEHQGLRTDREVTSDWVKALRSDIANEGSKINDLRLQNDSLQRELTTLHNKVDGIGSWVLVNAVVSIALVLQLIGYYMGW